jgi:hypothetical protein
MVHLLIQVSERLTLKSTLKNVCLGRVIVTVRYWTNNNNNNNNNNNTAQNAIKKQHKVMTTQITQQSK